MADALATTNNQALTFLTILLLFTLGGTGGIFTGDNSLLFLTILLLFLGNGLN